MSNSLEEIKNLNSNSTWKDIKKVLLKDYKIFADIDTNRTFYLKEEYVEKLKYTSDTNYKNIKNFLRYRTAGSACLDIYKNNFDCDCCSDTIEVLRYLLEKEFGKDNIQFNKPRVFIIKDGNQEISIETDTMNSVWTLLNDYMPNIKTVFDRFSILLGNQDICGNELVLKQFDNYCLLTHTIGNFVYVPKGYNVGRYNLTLDFSDLTIIDLKRQKDDNFIWYKDNFSKLYMNRFVEDINKSFDDIRPKELFDNHLNKDKKPCTLRDLSKCLDTMNRNILLRGLDIIKSIQPEVKNEVDKVISLLENDIDIDYLLNEDILDNIDKSNKYKEFNSVLSDSDLLRVREKLGIKFKTDDEIKERILSFMLDYKSTYNYLPRGNYILYPILNKLLTDDDKNNEKYKDIIDKINSLEK